MSETVQGRILDGVRVAAEIRDEVARGVVELRTSGGRTPCLTAVRVGDDPASKIYVASKARMSEDVGFVSRVVELPETLGEAELLSIVDELNGDPEVDGILVQLPLPRQIAVERVLSRVDPAKDVDGFHPLDVGRLWLGQAGLRPATPAGILELLRREGVELPGRHAVIVGRSDIVGKPLAALLLAAHATVTICHSRTRELAAHCRRADLLVGALGRPGFLGDEHVADGAVVIDVGINRVDDRATVDRLCGADAKKLAAFEKRGSVLVGDVDFEAVKNRVAAITPVPGGVGPLTIAMLLANTLTASAARQSREWSIGG